MEGWDTLWWADQEAATRDVFDAVLGLCSVALLLKASRSSGLRALHDCYCPCTSDEGARFTGHASARVWLMSRRVRHDQGTVVFHSQQGRIQVVGFAVPSSDGRLVASEPSGGNWSLRGRSSVSSTCRQVVGCPTGHAGGRN